MCHHAQLFRVGWQLNLDAYVVSACQIAASSHAVVAGPITFTFERSRCDGHVTNRIDESRNGEQFRNMYDNSCEKLDERVQKWCRWRGLALRYV